MTSFPAIKPQCIHHILHSSIDVNVGEGEDDVVCWAIAAAAIPMHTTKNALPAAVVRSGRSFQSLLDRLLLIVVRNLNLVNSMVVV